MNENLNLTQSLKDCPKGTKLWSSVWGDVTLVQINDTSFFPIVLSAHGFVNVSLRSDGKMYEVEEAECLLFPSKEQRDWSKFKGPIEKFNPEEFKPFDKILIRDGDEFRWRPSLFDRILKEPSGKYSVVDIARGCRWKMCIPYNDETKQLAGTAYDCSDYYKWWED